MLIDEAIRHEKWEAKYAHLEEGVEESIISIKKDYHKQMVEWLEELKELRKLKETYKKGMETSYATFMYNKAIDDFLNGLDKKGLLGTDDCSMRIWVNQIAEQLKK